MHRDIFPINFNKDKQTTHKKITNKSYIAKTRVVKWYIIHYMENS